MSLRSGYASTRYRSVPLKRQRLLVESLHLDYIAPEPFTN